MSSPSPGWYPDPQDPTAERWWDGQRWTSGIRPSATDARSVAPTDSVVRADGGGGERGAQPSGRAGGRRGLLVLSGVLLAIIAGAVTWLVSGWGGPQGPTGPLGQPTADVDGRQGQSGPAEADALDDWAADLVRRIDAGTAELSFRRVLREIPPGTPRYDEGPDCRAPVAEHGQLPLDEPVILCGSSDDAIVDPDTGEKLPSKLEVGPAELTGESVEDASVEVGQGSGQRSLVGLELDEEGGAAFASLTADLACERDQGRDGRLAIVIDGTVESTPGMNPSVVCGVGITGGTASITGPAG